MEKNEFFKEATLRICGNLEIEESLFSVFHFLRKVMPLDWISLQLYEESLKSVRTIAIATEKEVKTVDFLTPLSKEAQEQIERKIKLKLPDVMLVVINPETEELYRDMMNFHKVKATSLMILALESKGNYIGSITLLSLGEKVFTKKDAELLSLLKEPFVISMSNTLRYREVVKLKDMLADDNRYLHREMHHLIGDDIIGANFGLKDVMEKVSQVANLDSPVLLLGETGVGKDVIANAIHYSSSRREGPFVKVNCGAIPESLIDSELFGHEKGAFTGAVTQKRGRFERADKGTIFLDEIGELPLQAQVRLLRVLQHKEIERIGGSKTIKLDIRFITATNRDLEEMVKANQFREDLWFRLNVFPIRIPPLRERKSDIPALLQYFIEKKAKELKLPGIPELAPSAIEPLINYEWKGNVRELENIVERALIINPFGPISFDNIDGIKFAKTAKTSMVTDGTETLDIITTRYIKQVLKKTGGKINGSGGAAEILGVNPNTLRNRMRKLGIPFGREMN
ncbi:Formate hydrogenlyase transcriptional activator [hydrothermal vent metagenome]|uniref:Formate hydrogenlyase transcriptional activator n=1 Tax=hydrothermal vent metagenome TaxID=652676 RepID=A0A3B1C984_9ZZZZ